MGTRPGELLVDDADVQIAKGGHGKGAGDGGGGHDEGVGNGASLGAFGTDDGALFDAEFVLFINNDEGESFEVYAFGKEGVGANDEAEGAVCQGAEDFFAFALRLAADEEADADFFAFEEFEEGEVVLFGEDFRGGHEGGLVADEGGVLSAES